jgi:hypothetical protein
MKFATAKDAAYSQALGTGYLDSMAGGTFGHPKTRLRRLNLG